MSDYDFEVIDLGNKGSQITLTRKRFRSSQIVIVLIALMSMFCLHFLRHYEPQCLVPSTIIVILAFIVYFLQKVHTECLTVISSLGVNIKQSSWISSHVQYFDIHHIQDIVIIEAVSMHSIICQLVLIPKKSSQNNKTKEKMYPLFSAFHPKLDHLKTTYSQVQKKLIIPMEKLSQC